MSRNSVSLLLSESEIARPSGPLKDTGIFGQKIVRRTQRAGQRAPCVGGVLIDLDGPIRVATPCLAVGTTSPDITSTSPLPSVVALGYQRLPLVRCSCWCEPMFGTFG